MENVVKKENDNRKYMEAVLVVGANQNLNMKQVTLDNGTSFMTSKFNAFTLDTVKGEDGTEKHVSMFLETSNPKDLELIGNNQLKAGDRILVNGYLDQQKTFDNVIFQTFRISNNKDFPIKKVNQDVYVARPDLPEGTSVRAYVKTSEFSRFDTEKNTLTMFCPFKDKEGKTVRLNIVTDDVKIINSLKGKQNTCLCVEGVRINMNDAKTNEVIPAIKIASYRFVEAAYHLGYVLKQGLEKENSVSAAKETEKKQTKTMSKSKNLEPEVF